MLYMGQMKKQSETVMKLGMDKTNHAELIDMQKKQLQKLMSQRKLDKIQLDEMKNFIGLLKKSEGMRDEMIANQAMHMQNITMSHALSKNET